MSIRAVLDTDNIDDPNVENYGTASKNGVLSLIKRNIRVLKRETALGARIDRSMVAEMEAEYTKLSRDKDPLRK